MRASGYDRVVADWYVEPAWAVAALLGVEQFDGLTWDPACGSGNIPRVFREHGLDCIGSDIVNRGFGETSCFFDSTSAADNIISNPPYGIIEPFLVRALERTTRKVAVLARLALLEGQKRQELLRSTPLARVWVSSRRISMPPGGSGIEAKGGAIAYAWFVWEHSYTGPPTVGWF